MLKSLVKLSHGASPPWTLRSTCKQALTRPQPDTDRLETPGTLPSGEQAPSPISGLRTNVTSSEMLSVTLALWPTAAYPITRELFGICKWFYLLLFRFPCRVWAPRGRKDPGGPGWPNRGHPRPGPSYRDAARVWPAYVPSRTGNWASGTRPGGAGNPRPQRDLREPRR